jgi:hypothetical protein
VFDCLIFYILRTGQDSTSFKRTIACAWLSVNLFHVNHTRAVMLGAPSRGVAAELGPGAYRDMWNVERVHPEGSYY